ncbi:MAG: hypothetical protein PUP46_07890 [Endozoicomonas sp. (ex Botrylloides leachii)]|nr:hypothetical protein [Endozoicomonas sp. (ex Botrylloides leachii)]
MFEKLLSNLERKASEVAKKTVSKNESDPSVSVNADGSVTQQQDNAAHEAGAAHAVLDAINHPEENNLMAEAAKQFEQDAANKQEGEALKKVADQSIKNKERVKSMMGIGTDVDKTAEYLKDLQSTKPVTGDKPPEIRANLSQLNVGADTDYGDLTRRLLENNKEIFSYYQNKQSLPSMVEDAQKYGLDNILNDILARDPSGKIDEKQTIGGIILTGQMHKQAQEALTKANLPSATLNDTLDAAQKSSAASLMHAAVSGQNSQAGRMLGALSVVQKTLDLAKPISQDQIDATLNLQSLIQNISKEKDMTGKDMLTGAINNPMAQAEGEAGQSVVDTLKNNQIRDIARLLDDPEKADQVIAAAQDPAMRDKVAQSKAAQRLLNDAQRIKDDPEGAQKILEASKDPVVQQAVAEHRKAKQVLADQSKIEADPEAEAARQLAANDPETLKQIGDYRKAKSVLDQVKKITDDPEKTKAILDAAADPENLKRIKEFGDARSVVARLSKIDEDPEKTKSILEAAQDPELKEKLRIYNAAQSKLAELKKITDNPEKTKEILDAAQNPENLKKIEDVRDAQAIVTRLSKIDEDPEKTKAILEAAKDPELKEKLRTYKAAQSKLAELKKITKDPEKTKAILDAAKDPENLKRIENFKEAKAITDKLATIDADPEKTKAILEAAKDPDLKEKLRVYNNAQRKVAEAKKITDEPEKAQALIESVKDPALLEKIAKSRNARGLIRDFGEVGKDPQKLNELMQTIADPAMQNALKVTRRAIKKINEPQADPLDSAKAAVGADVQNKVDGVMEASKGVNPADSAQLADNIAKGQLQEAVQALQNVTPKQQANLINKGWLSKITDVALESYYNYILSSPATLVRNFMGNLSNLSLDIAGRFGGSLVSTLRQQASGIIGASADEGATLRDALNHSKGLMDGISDGYYALMHTIRTGDTLYNGSKLDVNNKAISSDALGISNQSASGRAAGMIVDAIGNYVRLPTRGMHATDELFKAVARKGMIHSAAAKEADRQLKLMSMAGASMDQQSARYDDIMKAVIDNPPDDIRLQAEDYAKRMNYSEDLTGHAARLFGSIIFTHPITRFLYLPFVKTPYNMMKQFVQTQVVGARFVTVASANALLTGLKKLSRGAIDKPLSNPYGEIPTAEGDMHVAKMAMGWGTAFSIGSLLHRNNITLTGKEPSNPKAAAAWRRMGVAPYSCVLKKPDGSYRSYSYSGWSEPFGYYLGALANAQFAWNTYQDTEHDPIAGAGALFLSTGDMVLNQPFLQGAAKFFELFQSSSTESAMENLERTAGQAAGELGASFLPLSDRAPKSILEAMADPSKMGNPVAVDNITRDNTFGTTLTNTAAIAFIKSMADAPYFNIKQTPAINYWGEQIDYTKGKLEAAFNPVRILDGEYSDVDQALIKDRIGLPIPSYKVGQVEMTPTERSDLFSYANAIKINGKQMKDALRAVIQSPAYQNANSFDDRQSLLGSMANKYLRKARKMVVSNDPERFKKADPVQLEQQGSIR